MMSKSQTTNLLLVIPSELFQKTTKWITKSFPSSDSSIMTIYYFVHGIPTIWKDYYMSREAKVSTKALTIGASNATNDSRLSRRGSPFLLNFHDVVDASQW